MTRGAFILAVCGLSACTGPQAISSMNYLQEPVDPGCVIDTLARTDGFAVAVPVRQRGDDTVLAVTFGEDVAVTGVLSNDPDGSSELSFFTRPDREATPLEQRKARFAVREADRLTHARCTADGQLDQGADIVLQTQS